MQTELLVGLVGAVVGAMVGGLVNYAVLRDQWRRERVAARADAEREREELARVEESTAFVLLLADLQRVRSRVSHVVTMLDEAPEATGTYLAPIDTQVLETLRIRVPRQLTDHDLLQLHAVDGLVREIDAKIDLYRSVVAAANAGEGLKTGGMVTKSTPTGLRLRIVVIEIRKTADELERQTEAAQAPLSASTARR